MSTTLSTIDHALRNATGRRLGYIVMGDERSLEIENTVIDRLLDERLTHATECKYGHPGATKGTVETPIGDTKPVVITTCATCDLAACFTCKKPLPPKASACGCGGPTWKPAPKPGRPEGVNA